MPLPIPLIIAAANLIPSIMKYAGAGDTAVAVAEGVTRVAGELTGVSDPVKAIEIIKQDPVLTQEFQLKVTAQYMDWDKMYLQDTQDARNRDVEMRKAGYVNSRANWMLVSAYIVVAMCFFATLYSNLDEYAKGIITLILGRMLGYIDQGFNFEFGTTRTSKTKDATIAHLSERE